MNRDEIANEYFTWLHDLVCGGRFSERISYQKMLMTLHNTEFIFLIPKDRNRANDGISLRYKFVNNRGYVDRAEVIRYLDGPCSVLEMMVALAYRCEQTIMDDPILGDRTGEWFWGMVTNLGLGSMYDANFDKHYTHEVVSTFLNREYEFDGRGGLFTVPNCDRDLRDVEIWHQMCWFLDSIT